MATLEKIRRRSGLLIIAIGLAMMAFILTDLLSSGGIFFQEDLNSVGEIDGTKIPSQEFARLLEEGTETYKQNTQDFNLERITTKQLVDAVWDEQLREILLGAQYEELGFTVTPDELYYEITNNPNVTNIAAFKDPNTGQFSDFRFKQVISQLKDQASTNEQAAQEWKGWRDFEDQVEKQALTFKYNNAIERGLYYPKRLAQLDYNRGGTNITLNFVQIPYTSIPDEEIEVSESDMKAYYNANQSDFRQEEATRDIQYVNFPIAPSAADNMAVKEELEGLIQAKTVYNSELDRYDTLPGFATTDSDSLFVNLNSDVPFDRTYMKKGELSPTIDSIMFQAEVGYIYGPYIENEGYKLSKLSGIKYLPDSVRARHILIAFQGAQRAGQNVTRTPQQARQLADSLFTAIKANRSLFDTISEQYSNDMVARSKGGDLGWYGPGTMAKPFSDFTFYNKKGEVGMVFTDFGFHIIEITDQSGSNKAVQVATIYREITPSEETIEDIYTKASQFASSAQQSENYADLAEQNGYALRPVTGLKAFDENIPGLGFNRKIVRWAFDEKTEEGSVQLIDNDAQSYVVVFLTDKAEKGIRPFEQVKEECRFGALRDKKFDKMAEQFKAAMESANNLEAIAVAVKQQPRQQILTSNQTTITGVGNEPEVIGIAAGSPSGELFGPIKGAMGGYVIRVGQVIPATPKDNYEDDQRRLQQALTSRVVTQTFQSIKAAADITDNRHRFY